jgi:imidazolonepropionase-like amidohydrolase
MKGLVLCGLMAGCVWPLAAGTEDTFLLRGATVHPVAGADIPGGSVLVRDGRIAEVGAKVAAPKGVRVIEVKGLHVYPGLIDSATTLGAMEIGSLRETSDTTDLGAFKPQLRIAIAFNPASEHIPVTRGNGITTALVEPAGGVIPGQAALMHMDGWTIEDMALRPSAAMRLDFPAVESGGGRGSARGTGGGSAFAEAKKRYEAQVRELEEFFEAARRYEKAKAAGGADFRTDLKLEAMLPVLAGKLPVLVRARKERTIREALAFAQKQKIRMILQRPPEAWKMAAELKAANIPVILDRTYSLPGGEDDSYDRAFSTPAELFKAGVKIAFATYGPGAGGNPFNLPYEAGAAAPFGLPPEEALKAVTLYPAQIFEVADLIGSIEKGKLADLIVTDGDPLETRTQVKQMFISGRAVDLSNKHKRLYEKYLNRP